MHSHPGRPIMSGNFNPSDRRKGRSTQTIGFLRLAMMSALGAALFLASAVNAPAQTYTVLYSFSGGADGAYPQSPVTMDVSTGELYGVTTAGGSGGCQYPGCGTVFELAPGGFESVLHSFSGPDGDGPIDVMLGPAGDLFGTTLGGGNAVWGTVFKINSKGAEKVLHNFTGSLDGAEPTSGLIQDPNSGDFYGVTQGGGTNSVGTLYTITASGKKTTLYNFGIGGDQPAGTLVQNQNTGTLYGLLDFGGPSSCGGVFQFTSAGEETALYFFTGQHGDGCGPGPGDPGLVMDTQGNLFGTTFFGGNANHGVVFELTADGVEKILYKFKGAKKGDGAWPYAGLVLDPNTGNLYGTTEVGGTGPCVSGKVLGCGTVFELSPPTTKHGKWHETVLHSFAGATDGEYPSAGLMRDAKSGNMYGTADAGGINNKGIVFEILQ